MNPRDYITTAQAAEMLGVTRQRFHDFVKEGRIKCVRFGHTRIILKDDVKNFKKIKRGPGLRLTAARK